MIVNVSTFVLQVFIYCALWASTSIINKHLYAICDATFKYL